MTKFGPTALHSLNRKRYLIHPYLKVTKLKIKMLKVKVLELGYYT